MTIKMHFKKSFDNIDFRQAPGVHIIL